MLVVRKKPDSIGIEKIVIRKKRNCPEYDVKVGGRLHSTHSSRREALKIGRGITQSKSKPNPEISSVVGEYAETLPSRTRETETERHARREYDRMRARDEERRRRRAERQARREDQAEYERGLKEAEEKRIEEQKEVDRLKKVSANQKILDNIANVEARIVELKQGIKAHADEAENDKTVKRLEGMIEALGKKLIIGRGLSSREIEKFTKASYKKKKDARSIGDYKLDTKLSSRKNKVYVNPAGKVVVANAGTSNLSDWANNLAIPFGLHHKTQRYKDAKKIQKQAIRKYGKENITNVAHSQSGNIVNNFAKHGLTNEAVAVNPAILGKHDKHVKVIRSSGDVVSAFTRTNKKDKVIKSKTYNPLIEHKPSILSR